MTGRIAGIGLSLLLTFCAGTTSAQDYRVYTRVWLQEQAQPEQKPELIGRSLTIWHAGKVYDYMDSIGELVVFDHQQQRYTIVSGPHSTACTVDYGELRQYLKVARTQAREYMSELIDSNRPDATRSIEKIKFQLDPKFEFRYSESPLRVVCDAPQLQYDVLAIQAPNSDIAQAFQQYADSAAQLNFVLHGQSLLPDARMQVNNALVQKEWIPVQVSLSLKDHRETVLRAEHAIQWELGPSDRTRLMEWKKLLQDGELRFVSFQEYQRQLLSPHR